MKLIFSDGKGGMCYGKCPVTTALVTKNVGMSVQYTLAILGLWPFGILKGRDSPFYPYS